jgi:hypothetical protein
MNNLKFGQSFINGLLELPVSPSVLTFAKGGCAEIGAKLINPSQDFD